MKTAHDRAIVGDDEQVPMVQRPQIHRFFAMTDPAEIVEGYVDAFIDVGQCVSRLHELVRAAARWIVRCTNYGPISLVNASKERTSSPPY